MDTEVTEPLNTASYVAQRGESKAEEGETMSSTEIEIVDSPGLVRRDQWAGAALRGLDARREREAIVKEILREGHDFGTVPGCGDKPALLKPGAEKIADALSLYPDYEEMDKIQDFGNRVWFYRYRCRLRQRGTDTVMSTGIGSCNSEAAKYKYRDAQRVCPTCGKPAIIKGREEYGGGWLCFTRKGGCSAKFADDDPKITEQTIGQVENPDIASVVNTVDKMAQKSAFVAACLNLGFSEQFTQDIDDNPSGFTENHNPPSTKTEPSEQVKCPECGGQMWDNRATKKGRQPDYKCKDKACNKAVWLNSESADTNRRVMVQSVADAFKLLNEAGDDPQWTPRSADDFVAKHFKGAAGVDQLDQDQINTLLKTLSERLDSLKTKKKPTRKSKLEVERGELAAKIRDQFRADVIKDELARHWNGQSLDLLSLDAMNEVYNELDQVPF